MLRVASRSGSRLIRYERRPTRVQRPTHKGLEAASRQIEPGEKMQMSPSGPRLVCSKADKVISTFSFDPNLEPCPHNLHRGEASGPPRPVSGTIGHLSGHGLRSSGMPHEGYADRVTNDGPRFHSNMPVSELTEHVT